MGGVEMSVQTTTTIEELLADIPAYDAGLLSDHGGGNVEWWQDYIRAELGRAHEFYALFFDSLVEAFRAQAAEIDFQGRVKPWMDACFGPEISADKIERNQRFLEEALELVVQACGCTRSEAHQLVDYVFDRDTGERGQEVGGVMVTLAALCLAQGLDMRQCGETELARIWTKVEKIRAKQADKPKHSPLPQSHDDALSAAQAKIAEQAAEIERLREHVGNARMCVNCGRIVDAQQYARGDTVDGCKSPDACCLDMTPQEAWLHWRDKCHNDRSAAQAQHRRDQERIAELEGLLQKVMQARRYYHHDLKALNSALDEIARAALQPKKGKTDA